ncbi:MAG TPA: SRPBCC family protein [Acidimicrobiales bacterium]|nr:SRPBCC family protein [Acidimicrobiales bacterium]
MRFDARRSVPAEPQAVWEELTDWSRHGAWVPATRVIAAPGDPRAAGATFTAWTGIGRLALEDRMRVTRCVWDPAARRGECEVEKLGPVLRGRAAFTVAPEGDGAAVDWSEDVTVPLLPQFLAGAVAQVSAAVFRYGLGTLARTMAGPPQPLNREAR